MNHDGANLTLPEIVGGWKIWIADDRHYVLANLGGGA